MTWRWKISSIPMSLAIAVMIDGSSVRSIARRLERLGMHALDGGQRRRLGGQPREERRDRRLVALDLEQHPALVVEHEAAERQLAGQAVDVRAEADALDDAVDASPDARPHDAVSTSSRSTW